jgi:hypothetical protein
MRQPKAHHLKTWPEHFQEVKAGRKTFEARKNDRDFQVGDVLILHEYTPENDEFTGDILFRQVPHMLAGPSFGIEEGYVVLSMLPWEGAAGTFDV